MIKINLRTSLNAKVQFGSSQQWYWIYAYKNHNRVGVVGVREDGFIHDLFVEENYRGKKVATRMLAKCEELVSDNLHFWHNPETPFEFYKKIGFKKRNGKLIRTKP